MGSYALPSLYLTEDTITDIPAGNTYQKHSTGINLS